MDLLQQGKDNEAEVFVGINTRQRNGLDMVSTILKEHLRKVANVTLERRPSQARELLGTKGVTEKAAAGATSSDQESSINQVEPRCGKRHHEIPMTPVTFVKDTKVPPGTMRELLVQILIGQEGIRLITSAYQHRDKEGSEHWTRRCLYPKAISLITE